MRIVVALGGNALLRRDDPPTAQRQLANIRQATAALAALCTEDNEVIVTHGNGPQVGLLALREAGAPPSTSQPLDVLNAETVGMLGYLIARELGNALASGKRIVSLITQVVVDANDPAFRAPSKPIGPLYTEDEARRHAADLGWTVVKDGRSWRRAIASPMPKEIVELEAIDLLARQGFVVICLGGGGIPVVRDSRLLCSGVEAIVDKDHSSALLARELDADHLLLLTDVDGVYLNWDGKRDHPVAVAGPDDFDLSAFDGGSMRPKIEAAAEFALKTGHCAAIGRLQDASAILAGQAGTRIDRSCSHLQVRTVT